MDHVGLQTGHLLVNMVVWDWYPRLMSNLLIKVTGSPITLINLRNHVFTQLIFISLVNENSKKTYIINNQYTLKTFNTKKIEILTFCMFH